MHSVLSRLESKWLTLLTERVSIHAATRDDTHQPLLTRVLGCRVDDQGLKIFLQPDQCPGFLEALTSCSRLAVAFCRPSTCETIQLKADDARIVPLVEGDWSPIRNYIHSFVQELGEMGYSDEFAHAILGEAGEDLVAVCFTPISAFDQTPGPKAGTSVFRS
ncbi:MAG: hypothetical protein KDC35_16845 [Acidobacteria bacterium]|nr:hypothetical protein [Acidobacteriota bacterium]